ncbi:MAG: GntR family transcriptional regulator [Spirochaetota bacterium]
MDTVEPEGGASLAEAVYLELKRRLNRGGLRPGDFIDQAALGAELGLSRAPLRDALIRLELEGFVSVFPRRGVMVRSLDLPAIRDIYEILGALEGAAAEHAAVRFGSLETDRMEVLLSTMDGALAGDDFDAYYAANLAFHDVYIALSPNIDLKRQVRILKERLYDFPRRSGFLREWEIASMVEHRELAARFKAGDFPGAGAWVRGVHWSYAVQERYIRDYYLGKEAIPAAALARPRAGVS